MLTIFSDIQKWWEIPCIAQFIDLFGKDFSIPSIDIESLERMLLNRGSDKVTGFTMHDLIFSLLGGIYKVQQNKMQREGYGPFLRRFIRTKCLPINMDLGDDFDIYTDFVDLPLRNQVMLLYSLCYLRIEPELDKSEKVLKREGADHFRAEPLGEDSHQNTYWYFNGTRLYLDEFISEDERLWSVICFQEIDWINLSLRFEKSRNQNEKILFSKLQEKLPYIHSITLKKLRLAKFSRHSFGGGDANLISSRTRSRRCNSIK